MDPADIVFPDVPDDLTFRLPYWDTAAKAMAYADPETVTVNPDQLLPIPIGFIEGDEAPALSLLGQYDDDEEFDGNITPIYLTGIVMSIDLEPSVPNGQNITLRTQTPGGNWFTVQVGIQNYIRTISVDDAMNETLPEISNSIIDLRIAFSEDKITTGNVTIVPGDMIALRIFDADHFDPENANSLLPRSIEKHFGITTGLSGFMVAIDRGRLDPDGEVSIGPRISYEQIIMAHE